LTQDTQAPNREEQEAPQILQDKGTVPLWKVAEVAKYLRINSETVRTMTRAGKLPAIKVGHSWRFRRQEIISWLQRKTAEERRKHSRWVNVFSIA
jgi:excisionase family DNA binding protein